MMISIQIGVASAYQQVYACIPLLSGGSTLANTAQGKYVCWHVIPTAMIMVTKRPLVIVSAAN